MIFVSAQLTTFLLAMLPVTELRGAIPLALGVYKLSAAQALLWSVFGNLVPVFFLLLFLEPVAKYLGQKNYHLNLFFQWLFQRTRQKHSKRFALWGSLALIAFVAIPLPMTGGWTGSVAAFVFGVEFKKAFPLIALGVIIAGFIVTAASLGVLAL